MNIAAGESYLLKLIVPQSLRKGTYRIMLTKKLVDKIPWLELKERIININPERILSAMVKNHKLESITIFERESIAVVKEDSTGCLNMLQRRYTQNVVPPGATRPASSDIGLRSNKAYQLPKCMNCRKWGHIAHFLRKALALENLSNHCYKPKQLFRD